MASKFYVLYCRSNELSRMKGKLLKLMDERVPEVEGKIEDHERHREREKTRDTTKILEGFLRGGTTMSAKGHIHADRMIGTIAIGRIDMTDPGTGITTGLVVHLLCVLPHRRHHHPRSANLRLLHLRLPDLRLLQRRTCRLKNVKHSFVPKRNAVWKHVCSGFLDSGY